MYVQPLCTFIDLVSLTDMPLALGDIQPLFGLPPSDPKLSSFLSRLGHSKPDIKTYPDAIFHNLYDFGISLCFEKNELESIDIFNSKPSSKSKYSSPPLPLIVEFAEPEVVVPPPKEGGEETRYSRPQRLEVSDSTVGKDLVHNFGEPSRKGSSDWVGVWLEWGNVKLQSGAVGIMLELADRGAGPNEQQKKEGMGGVWDRASEWPWGSIKVFRATSKPK